MRGGGGPHDKLLFYQAVHARDTIPGAEHVRVPEGSHFGAWISPCAREVQEEIIRFVKVHSAK